jgi:hypothetical protein
VVSSESFRIETQGFAYSLGAEMASQRPFKQLIVIFRHTKLSE